MFLSNVKKINHLYYRRNNDALKISIYLSDISCVNKRLKSSFLFSIISSSLTLHGRCLHLFNLIALFLYAQRFCSLIASCIFKFLGYRLLMPIGFALARRPAS